MSLYYSIGRAILVLVIVYSWSAQSTASDTESEADVSAGEVTTPSEIKETTTEETLDFAPVPSSYFLDNGLRVIFDPYDAATHVAVAVIYHSGSRDDPPGYENLAHLLEHLMFHGTGNTGPNGHFRRLEREGSINVGAQTTPDYTVYHQLLDPKHLPLAIWLESDRMAYLLNNLDASAVEKEKRVLAREWQERTANHAMSLFHLHTLSVLVGEEHPYARPMPQLDDLDAITLENVRWFFQQHYRPDNATVVLSGRFLPAEAKGLMEKFFGSIKTGTTSDELVLKTDCEFPSFSLPGPVEIEVTGRTVYEQVSLTWPFSPLDHKSMALLRLWKHIFQFRFNRWLENDGDQIRDVQVGFRHAELLNQFVIVAVGEMESEAEKFKETLFRGFSAVSKKPATKDELAMARLRVSPMRFEAQNPLLRAIHLGTQVKCQPLWTHVEMQQLLDGLTETDLDEAANDMLSLKNATVALGKQGARSIEGRLRSVTTRENTP